MLRFELSHYGTGSVITCLDGLHHNGAIVYTRKIHRYESDADFSTIKTELQTYGERAAYEIFTYFRDSRKYTQKDSAPAIQHSGNFRVDISGHISPRRPII